MTLLIIEDNFDLLHLYRMSMKLVQISPEIETTGLAALRRIQNLHMDPPEVVILDLHLKREHGQEINGEELFHVMRETWPKTKTAQKIMIPPTSHRSESRTASAFS